MFVVGAQVLYAADNNKLQGQALCNAGCYAEAIPFLEKSVAKNNRSGAWWYLAIARQHLYDFDGAVEAVEAYMPVLHSEEWLTRADSLMTTIQIGQRAFEHTLDVVVIDSMLVSRDGFFRHYKLGEDCGKIQSAPEGLYYENAKGDHQIFPQNGGFAERHSFQGQWEDLQPLHGIGSTDYPLIDPFLLSDGTTLYFASDSIPGMGGLDIYRTTLDAETGEFYQPERLGMPFNSPFDDYMMAIDESHHVGWWATERGAVPDSVMIYVFLWDEDEATLDEPTVSRARIDRIADTWRNEAGYAVVLQEIMTPKAKVEEPESAIYAVIADGLVYTREEQFHSDQAREVFRLSVIAQQQIANLETSLLALRQAYSSASDAEQKGLKSRILHEESNLLSICHQYRQLQTTYRQFENDVIHAR